MNDDNQVFIFEDASGEFEFHELFRFTESTNFNKTYIVLYYGDVNNLDGEAEIQAYVYAPDKDQTANEDALLPIESEEEWDMVTEMINIFFEDPQINN